MARYHESVCRLCRREGIKLFLKGDRCYSEKCAVSRRPFAPGAHTQGRKKSSEYGLQLREKQKTRRFYGVLEKPFRNYFQKAGKQRGVTGENLLQLLERRLDNVVYRLGFANSRPEARQLVTHGHFILNNHKANIPSILVKPNDEIAVLEKSKKSPKFQEILSTLAQKTPPKWLQRNTESLSGKVLALPSREELDIPVEEHLIIELYSR